MELSVNDLREIICPYKTQTYFSTEPQGLVKIAILQRGWVFVGNFYKNGSHCKLENASVIRVWGTTNGIGQIALSGPTSNTKLDKCPTVEFHELTAVAIIPCNHDNWKL